MEQKKNQAVTPGDASILRFLAAAEILLNRSVATVQRARRIQDNEVPEGVGVHSTPRPLKFLTRHGPVHPRNTEDELTHEVFIHAYLASKGADTVTWTDSHIAK